MTKRVSKNKIVSVKGKTVRFADGTVGKLRNGSKGLYVRRSGRKHYFKKHCASKKRSGSHRRRSHRRSHRGSRFGSFGSGRPGSLLEMEGPFPSYS